MNGFCAYIKKEFLEQLRSYRALIIWIVLFLFGMSSPLLAKMTPDILSHMSVQGVVISLPKPVAMDAWAQFFKNISQMGIIVLMLVFAGSLSQEFSKGTLILPLSRGLSRGAVLAAKFVASAITWTTGYALAAVTACFYTQSLFGRFAEPSLFFSLFCLWLFGVFLIACLLAAGAVVPGSFGGLLTTAAFLCLLMMLNIAPKLQKINPVTIASQNAAALSSSAAAADMRSAAWVTLALTVLCLLGALAAFRKKKI